MRAARVQAAFADALIVHRLDMGTSGILVFGRGGQAQRTLSLAFAERRVDKRYSAWCLGRPRENALRAMSSGLTLSGTNVASV